MRKGGPIRHPRTRSDGQGHDSVSVDNGCDELASADLQSGYPSPVRRRRRGMCVNGSHRARRRIPRPHTTKARMRLRRMLRAIDVLTANACGNTTVRSNHYVPLCPLPEDRVCLRHLSGEVLDAENGQSLCISTRATSSRCSATYSHGQQFFAHRIGTNVFAFGLSDSR